MGKPPRLEDGPKKKTVVLLGVKKNRESHLFLAIYRGYISIYN